MAGTLILFSSSRLRDIAKKIPAANKALISYLISVYWRVDYLHLLPSTPLTQETCM